MSCSSPSIFPSLSRRYADDTAERLSPKMCLSRCTLLGLTSQNTQSSPLMISELLMGLSLELLPGTSPSPSPCDVRPDSRYGRVPAQVSTFFDQCGGLWASGAMIGKFVSAQIVNSFLCLDGQVSMFTSTGGQHGGQEVSDHIQCDNRILKRTLIDRSPH